MLARERRDVFLTEMVIVAQHYHTIFNPEVDVYLMQDIPHARRRSVGQHDQAQVARRLVEVQLVLAGSVADEGVVFATELADHVAQRKYRAEDELGVVGCFVAVGDALTGAAAAVCGGKCVWPARGGISCRGREPFLGIDAFRWWVWDLLTPSCLSGWALGETTCNSLCRSKM